MSVLRGTNHHSINNHNHSHESIRLLVEREISPEYLETSDRRCVAYRVNGSSLLGLDISFLRNLSLCQCQIGDENVFSMVHGSSILTEIRLLDCCGITDASMIALGRYYRQLISIDVGRCDNISYIGLTGFADACCNVSDAVNFPHVGIGTGLRGISLLSCERITDIGISAFARSSHLPNDIDISGCRHVTDTGISALRQSISLLSDIKISDCSNITDMGVSALGLDCPLLTNINLYSCRNITDIGV